MSAWFPPLVHADRDTRNGHYPSSAFYGAAVRAANHQNGYADRSVFGYAWRLGDGPLGVVGTTTYRGRFRSRPGASQLRMVLMLLKTNPAGKTIAPRVDVVITEVGVGSTTQTFDLVPVTIRVWGKTTAFDPAIQWWTSIVP